jgi:hypothetical protein
MTRLPFIDFADSGRLTLAEELFEESDLLLQLSANMSGGRYIPKLYPLTLRDSSLCTMVYQNPKGPLPPPPPPPPGK